MKLKRKPPKPLTCEQRGHHSYGQAVASTKEATYFALPNSETLKCIFCGFEATNRRYKPA